MSGSFDLRDAFYRKHQTMRLRDMFHNVTKALIGDNYDDFVRYFLFEISVFSILAS